MIKLNITFDKKSIMKYIYITLAIIFLSVSLTTIFKLKEKIKNMEIEKECLMIENSILVDNSIQQIIYNRFSQKDFTIYDNENKSLLLSNLLSPEYKLVFKFSSLHCISCIESILKEIKKLDNHILKERLLIIGSFENKRAVESFKKKYNVEFPMYFIKNNKEEISGIEDRPYIYLMNNKMTVDYLLYPVKETPILLQQYLKVICKQYLNWYMESKQKKYLLI